MPANAWISSTITVRVDLNMARPLSLVSRMYSDSGVVTRICGGRRRINARLDWGVSPVRTAVRTATSGYPAMTSCSRMPVSGASRLRAISLLSALSGDTYTTCTPGGNAPSNPCRMSSSMTVRKAASVFPAPVGAATSKCFESTSASQTLVWTGVGAKNALRSQASTAG